MTSESPGSAVESIALDSAVLESAVLESIETPVGLIDEKRMRANVDRVVEYCRRHDLTWRPHVKTHKCPEIARLAIEAGATGLTVATPHEAEVMAEVTGDLLMAYPPVGASKVDRIVRLSARADPTVALDSEVVLRSLSDAASMAGREIGVLVEVDAGARRVGLDEPAAIVNLARVVARSPGVRYRGILFYPGHIRKKLANHDADIRMLDTFVMEVCRALDAEGLTPEVVSGGSTPTLWRSHEIERLTEIRSGTTVFNDRDIALMEACEWSDCAYAVLATVVSVAVPGQAVVDAGSKALSKETRAGADGPGFGQVVGRPEVVVSKLSEEHGMLDISGSDWRPRVGEKVRILPNHVCVSVNLQDALWSVDQDGDLRRWELTGRGREEVR